MAVILLDAKVVGGSGGPNNDSVPYKPQVGGATAGMILNNDPIRVVDLSRCTDAEKKMFSFSNHWQIFNAAGRPYNINFSECWMEASHIALTAAPVPEPEPEPEPEPGGDVIDHEVVYELFQDGRHFIGLKKV
jgi:hypothetical protein